MWIAGKIIAHSHYRVKVTQASGLNCVCEVNFGTKSNGSAGWKPLLLFKIK